MPRCEGRPTGPCPDGRNDPSVRSTQGDLFLCKGCEDFRFPLSVKVSTPPNGIISSVINCNGSGSVDVASENSSTVSLNDGTQTSQNGRNVQATSTSPSLVANELLFFVNSTYDCYPSALIKSTVLDFFREDEILIAKSKLIASVDSLDNFPIQPYCKNRIGSNKLRASFDDIMNIFAVADESGKRSYLPAFCAVDRKRIPVFEDEMSEIGALRYEVSLLKKQLEEISQGLSLAGLYQELSVMQQQVHELCHTVSASFAADRRSESKVQADTNTASSIDRIGLNNDLLPVSDDQQSLLHQADDKVDQLTAGSAVIVTALDRRYADTVKQNLDKDWHKVTSKKEKKIKKTVVGDSNKTCIFQGVAKKAVVCVNRLHPSTTTELLTDFLTSNDITVYSCFLLEQSKSDRQPRYVSMRLCVPQAQLNKVMDSNLWPLGVVVRPWSFKSNK